MTHTITQTQKEKIVFANCKITYGVHYDDCYLVQYNYGGNDTTSPTLKGAISKAYRNLLADGII